MLQWLIGYNGLLATMVNWLQWFIGYNGLLVTMVYWLQLFHEKVTYNLVLFTQLLSIHSHVMQCL